MSTRVLTLIAGFTALAAAACAPGPQEPEAAPAADVTFQLINATAAELFVHMSNPSCEHPWLGINLPGANAPGGFEYPMCSGSSHGDLCANTVKAIAPQQRLSYPWMARAYFLVDDNAGSRCWVRRAVDHGVYSAKMCAGEAVTPSASPPGSASEVIGPMHCTSVTFSLAGADVTITGTISP